MRTIDRKAAPRPTEGQNRQDTLSLIRTAGLDLIYERGYEGVGLRLLAARAGIGQSTLYGHYANKQDVLVDLICLHMEELLSCMDKAVPAGAAPFDRFLIFVRFHLTYHMRRRREVFICYSELRSLEPDNHARVTGLRRRYEHALIGIIRDGMAAGVMRRADPRVAAYAILAMLSGVTPWFDPKGPLSEEAVCKEYIRLAVAAVVDPVEAALTGRGADH
ncbi:TetR/AcrR family transcriptional regulator [Paracoccus nototheniae]|uniref:TetR/AcrR family transcriptional regulator n=1 Tax=Paracoccus nototheniae TaxID=2489002 RepID=A0ABW4DX38_9RHOB|nr:TetR/AcrR family transcriptional regulator [Paracoccus nototheniae]